MRIGEADVAAVDVEGPVHPVRSERRTGQVGLRLDAVVESERHDGLGGARLTDPWKGEEREQTERGADNESTDRENITNIGQDLQFVLPSGT